MANYIHLTGDNNPTPLSVIYKKTTNNFGGWSYAARPEAEDSKFYELNGEWFYVVKDVDELYSLRNQGSWMTSTDPNQLVSITDKDEITKSIPMNNLVTTRVVSISSMFSGSITSFNQYIGNWDTGNVESMFNAFSLSSFNQPIGNWDTGKVSNMEGAFDNSPFNQPIENWDTGNVVNMRSMFSSTPFNQPIGNWDTGNLRNIFGIFTSSSFNQPIGNWAVHNVTDMRWAFQNNVVFNQDLSSWCVSGVTNHADFDFNTPAWTLPKPNFSNPPC